MTFFFLSFLQITEFFYNIGKKPMLYLNVLKGKDYVDVAFVHGVLYEK